MTKFKMEDGSFIEADQYATARKQYLAAKLALIAPVDPPQVVALAPVRVKAVLTPVDNFAGRSKLRYGLGEEIDLSFVTTPQGQSADSFGGLRWVVASGVASVDLPNAINGVARLTCGGVAGTVKLQLVSVGGANPGAVMVSASIVIVVPTDARIVRAPNSVVFHNKNTASAGFKGWTYLDPVDVSFYRCQFREGSATYSGTGYYTRESAELADIRRGVIRHPTMAQWIPISRGGAQGSRTQSDDGIRSHTFPLPCGAGTFIWAIPFLVQMIGGTDELVFTTANHTETLTATGVMTISKKGTTVTCDAGDATSNF